MEYKLYFVGCAIALIVRTFGPPRRFARATPLSRAQCFRAEVNRTQGAHEFTICGYGLCKLEGVPGTEKPTLKILNLQKYQSWNSTVYHPFKGHRL